MTTTEGCDMLRSPTITDKMADIIDEPKKYNSAYCTRDANTMSTTTTTRYCWLLRVWVAYSFQRLRGFPSISIRYWGRDPGELNSGVVDHAWPQQDSTCPVRLSSSIKLQGKVSLPGCFKVPCWWKSSCDTSLKIYVDEKKAARHFRSCNSVPFGTTCNLNWFSDLTNFGGSKRMSNWW